MRDWITCSINLALGDEEKNVDPDGVRVGTGTKSVDDALGGGIRGGNVLGLWGDGCEVSFFHGFLERRWQAY